MILSGWGHARTLLMIVSTKHIMPPCVGCDLCLQMQFCVAGILFLSII
jgi:hypothetical protein